MAKPMICTACGTSGRARKETPGSFIIEVILWLCFLVPGLIYTIWRYSRKHWVCEVCKSPNLVPLDSPAGRTLAEKYRPS